MLDLKASFHSPEDSYEGNNQREKDFFGDKFKLGFFRDDMVF